MTPKIERKSIGSGAGVDKGVVWLYNMIEFYGNCGGNCSMRIADAHCDTLFSIGVHAEAAENCVVTAERMRRGGVALQTFALFAGAQGPAGHPYEKAVAMCRAMDRVGVPMLLGRLPEEMPEEPTGIISIEGCEVFEGSVARIDEFSARYRVRLAALTWNNENELGYSAKSGSGEGLKPFGKRFVEEAGRRGILCDVSHLNDAGFWELIDKAALPPVASHSNCRALCDTFRNLTDDMIRALIERGGYMGMNFYSNFLCLDRAATIDDVLAHMDHVLELGGEEILGFGSDFDGIESWPEGLGNPADFPALVEKMRAHGYSDELVEKICWKNFWRVLKLAEGHGTI